MRRALALLLGPILIVASGVVPFLHTHAYDDHDHPEHHHGLAIHQHHTTRHHGADRRDRDADRIAHLEGCDAGTHAVAFAFVCAAPPEVELIDEAIASSGTATPEIRAGCGTRHDDVRVHGPPALVHASPRAPPSIALARYPTADPGAPVGCRLFEQPGSMRMLTRARVCAWPWDRQGAGPVA